MMANVELTCSVCSHSNLVQRVHANMLVKNEMRTFCSQCGIVTLQSISGGSAPPVAAQTPIRSNSPTRSITSAVPLDDYNLWKTLEQQLTANGLLMDDVVRRDDDTRARLFGSLGFGMQEEQRLVEMAKKKLSAAPAGAGTVGGSNASNTSSFRSLDGGAGGGMPSTPPAGPTEPNKMTAPARPMTNPSPAPGAGGYQPVATPSSMAAGRGTPPGANRNTPAGGMTSPGTQGRGMPGTTGTPGSSTAPNRLTAASGGPGGESSVKGLTMGADGNIVARCSVFPHLPAEYWCCACSVLVSSRCHVQGIHKDHPFVPLRLAAESHVRDLCAWNDRCRAQLNVIDTIANNLKHCEDEMTHNLQRELVAVDEAAEQVKQELERWKEQLKSDVQIQVNAQMGGLQFARERTQDLREHYGTYLSLTEPLMNAIPPVNAEDRDAEHWALRVLDAVTKMKHVTAEAIPIPKLSIPQVQCNAAPSMFMELLKCASIPLQMKLPDLIDPGYFNYPHPSSSAKQAFTLVAQGDPASKGLVITNGRTLTRTQDVLPSHCLVMGSQVLYSGNHGWEVHVDRIGGGGGRVLAGIVVNGSDGEGVVWDGNRIVGPNEGEVRNLDDKIHWQTGSILRFYLELEGPTGYLSCFFNNEGVARIPLPASGSGWTPAFSVFGPQDQITIAPSTTSAGGPGVAIAGASRPERRNPAAASGDTMEVLEQQASMLNALHQQISHVNFKLEQQALSAANPRGTEPSQPGVNMSQTDALNPQQGGGYQGGGYPQHNTTNMSGGGGGGGGIGGPHGLSPNPARPGAGGFDPNATVHPGDASAMMKSLPPHMQQPQQQQMMHHQQQGGGMGASTNPAAYNRNASAVPAATQGASNIFSGTDTYSPELRQIMKYVETVHQ